MVDDGGSFIRLLRGNMGIGLPSSYMSELQEFEIPFQDCFKIPFQKMISSPDPSPFHWNIVLSFSLNLKVVSSC